MASSAAAAPPQSADQTETLLSSAKALFEAGNFTEADRAVRQFLQNHPDSADAHFLLGHILFREISAKWLESGKALNKFPEAQAELEKAIELTPQAPNLHCLLAPVYRKQGLAERAKAESDRCAALTGTHFTS